MKKATFWLIWIPLFLTTTLFAKPPQLEPRDVNAKVNELLFTHISQKKLNKEIIKRSLDNMVNELDAFKCYFLKSEVEPFLNPSDEKLSALLEDFYKSDFKTYDKLYQIMRKAIQRRERLEKRLDREELLSHVDQKELDELDFAYDEDELFERLLKVKSIQAEVIKKMDDEDFKSKFSKIIEKRRKWREEEIIGKNEKDQKQILHGYILKSIASALDSQTLYFLPEEAKLFMMQVQQKLMGIGVKLIDNLTGFKVMSLLDDGPAKIQGGLKENDLIVAVDNEYVVGMDINQAVQLIRGKKNTKVKLTVLREESELNNEPQKHEVTITRDEIVLEENRIEAKVEPFADGHIAHITLHTFYQDAQSSSAEDLHRKLKELQDNYNLKGVILDLRNNTGGILPQTVGINKLFMGKGIVVSIKNYDGTIQHLRNVDPNPEWKGPLVVLVNKLSASAAEIVAQSLQDYGRAIIVGDERSFGKGTYQLSSQNFQTEKVNPQGEYKVTQGMYYTVSGKSPQLVGVLADIVAPSYLKEAEIGECFSKYPVENESIAANYEDRLEDIPIFQLEKVKKYYHYDLQTKMDTFTKHLDQLKANSLTRIENNKDYQAFIKSLDKSENSEAPIKGGENDHQLHEAFNIMKDLIYLHEKNAKAA